jgi:hypothetical protein
MKFTSQSSVSVGDGAKTAVEKVNMMCKVAKSKETVKKYRYVPLSCYSVNVDTNIYETKKRREN